MNSYFSAALLLVSSATSLYAAPDADGFTEQMTALIERGGSPRKLKQGETATTKAKFRPPVEIIIVAKTDSNDLRMSYAANKVAFNFDGGSLLRVEGGPAEGQSKPGAGVI